MSDYYTEQLVKRKTPVTSNLMKVGLICLTMLSCLLVFMLPFGIMALVIMVVLDVILFKRMNVEFEYIYVNGELDIDKIMSKEKRKKMFGMQINDLEMIAPSGSAEVRIYQNIKAIDYSTLVHGHKTYEMIVVKNGSKSRVIFEPNKMILDGMRMLAPRKVII